MTYVSASIRMSFVWDGPPSDGLCVDPQSGEGLVCLLEDMIEDYLIDHPKTSRVTVKRGYTNEEPAP